ncbi:MAG: metallophosphoesterase [Solirubrobacteraceae bacterium]
MRTLVISDLHLGRRAGHDVLRLAAVRERLLDALDDVDRLVLLGDALELMGRNPRRTMATAEPIIRAIGRRLGPNREVIVVPGNHDAPLVRAWALAQGRRLQPSTTVEPHASRALDRLLAWLAPARTRVSYPGVWLGERVWATHGHYIDRHLVPESSFGILRRRVRGVVPAVVAPIEYERGRRPRRRSRDSLMTRALARPAGTLLESVAELARSATMPRVPRLMMNSGLAPVTARLIDAQMRHQSLPAMAYVVRRLGVDADWVLFGHVHRRGPIGGPDWVQNESMRFVNTGSWVYDPLLVDRAVAPHPYWPGGAVLLDDGREPRSLGLLDDLGAEQLRPGART